MKFLILTRQLNDYPELIEQIRHSDIMKVSVNHTPIKSDYRVFHDYNKWSEYGVKKYAEQGEKLVTVYAGLLVMPKNIWMYYKPVDYPSFNNDKNEVLSEHPRGNAEELYFKGGSIIPSIDLALRLGATDVLVIADNTVYGEKFQDLIKDAIKELKAYANIYCFKADNNLNLPYKNITDFIGEI